MRPHMIQKDILESNQVDGEKSPPMGHIYVSMKKTKQLLKVLMREKYKKIMEIIDR